MSGNGVRCLVRRGSGRYRHESIRVDRRHRIRSPYRRRSERGSRRRSGRSRCRHGSGDVRSRRHPLARGFRPTTSETTFHGVAYHDGSVDMGNPHFSSLCRRSRRVEGRDHGSRLEVDERFPKRTNVEFVSVESLDHMRMRVGAEASAKTLLVRHRRCAGPPRRAPRRPGRQFRHPFRCAAASSASLSFTDTIVPRWRRERVVFDVDVDLAKLGSRL